MNRNKKIGLISSVVIILLGLGYLAFGNFKKNLTYFFTPSEVVAFSREYDGKKVRVAGLVVKNSMKAAPHSQRIDFEMTDQIATIPVTFEGVPPDLFKEGQGAVVEGYWGADKRFHSHMIMAKHSEDYMPIEMKKAGVQLPKKDFIKTLKVD